MAGITESMRKRFVADPYLYAFYDGLIAGRKFSDRPLNHGLPSKLYDMSSTRLLAEEGVDRPGYGALQAFAVALFKDWPDQLGIDGFDLQDLAVELGLLSGKQVTEPCDLDGNCNCLSYEGADGFPLTCYHRAAFIVAGESNERDRGDVPSPAGAPQGAEGEAGGGLPPVPEGPPESEPDEADARPAV
jgi:hypothetical protein